MSVSGAISSLSVHDVSGASGTVAGFQAALTGACVVPLTETGWIRVAGEDRVRWLNGMVTNSIQALGPGEGCFNFLLNAQGRIQGTATAFAAGDAILMETDCGQVDGMMAMLDRFIIMDDVELADASGERAGLLVGGPAAEMLLRTEGWLPEGLGGGGIRAADTMWQGEPVRVQGMAGKVVPRYEIWAATDVVERMRAALIAGEAGAGGARVLEGLRLLEGTPKFGVDLREKELPQETGQTEALHFSKGCYLGQEIVERIRSRGAVHRTFAGFALEGEMPAAGAVLSAGGKAVGELTSVGVAPAVAGLLEGVTIGLGYIRREVLELKQPIEYDGGVAEPVPLPVAIGTAS